MSANINVFIWSKTACSKAEEAREDGAGYTEGCGGLREGIPTRGKAEAIQTTREQCTELTGRELLSRHHREANARDTSLEDVSGSVHKEQGHVELPGGEATEPVGRKPGG